MSTYQKIIDLLAQNKTPYKELRHKPVVTSEEAFKVRSDISLSQGAKALIVRCKSRDQKKFFVMLVLPGDKRFNSKKLKNLISANSITFASEEEVFSITNGVLPGGVPPFGSIFNLKTYVDYSLLVNSEIAFNAGDRSISIVMKTVDWLNLETPQKEDIT